VPRIEATAPVPVPPAVAFAISQSQGELRYRWDPFVREQRLLDGAERPARGVRTFTRSRHGLTMVSEYLAFNPPRQVGMRMVSGPWFFRSFSGGWGFAPRPDGTTDATWRYSFKVRPGWLRAGGRPPRAPPPPARHRAPPRRVRPGLRRRGAGGRCAGRRPGDRRAGGRSVSAHHGIVP
jgi:hypothetical protein